MDNSYLGRGEAPFGKEIWGILERVMIQAAKSTLTARRIINLEGPFGFGLKGIQLNDHELEPGITSSGYLPLFNIYKSFLIGKRDLANFEREKTVLPLNVVAEAAIECSKREDEIIFYGKNGFPGLMNSKGSSKIDLSPWDKVGNASEDIIKAITKLDSAGFHGPYTLALSPQRFNLLFRIYGQGNISELEQVKTMSTEGVVKASIIKKGGVLMESGSHVAAIVLGQDMNIGYNGPSSDKFEFIISESIALNLRLPDGICTLGE